MRRPLTWLSGTLLAGIFLAVAATLTAAPSIPAPAAYPVAAAAAAPASSHHPASRILAYDRPHPVLAATATSYVVRRGDTFSSIARTVYGHARLWPALWFINRREARNPDALRSGITLTLSAWHPDKAWLYAKALANVPKPPPPPPPASAQLAASTAPASESPAAAAPAPAASGSVVPGSAYETCVIRNESGGNPDAVNPTTGAGGIYQFLQSTWSGLGYPGSPIGAPVAEQQAAFDKLYAQAGSAPWSSDGCG